MAKWGAPCRAVMRIQVSFPINKKLGMTELSLEKIPSVLYRSIKKLMAHDLGRKCKMGHPGGRKDSGIEPEAGDLPRKM